MHLSYYLHVGLKAIAKECSDVLCATGHLEENLSKSHILQSVTKVIFQGNTATSLLVSCSETGFIIRWL